jgi:hypothetical protein
MPAGTTLSDVSAPRPAPPRALIAGTLLVLAGLAFWALFVKQSGGVEQHAYNRAGHPPSYAGVVTGKTYNIAIHGGVDREVALGLDPAQLTCTAARPGQVPGALNLVAENKDSKATNQIASFVSAITGQVHVECKGIGTVYLENAVGASFDWSGVWLVLASLALAVGLPLGLSALRSPAGSSAGASSADDSGSADVGRVDPAAEEVL